MELLDGRSATFVGGNFLDLHDLDGVSAGTMTGTHVAVLRKRKTRIKNTNMAGFVECLDIDEAEESVEKEEGELPFLFMRIIIRMSLLETYQPLMGAS